MVSDLRPQPGGAAELLQAHDRQLRSPAALATTPETLVEELGPLLRVTRSDSVGLVLLRGDQAVAAADLEPMILEQLEHFRALGQNFEWKTFSHDQPLAALLLRHGLRPGDPETIMVARADAVPPCQLPDGVTVRPASSNADFERLGHHQRAAFGSDHEGATERARIAVQASPERVVVLLAETGGELVGSARVEFLLGTQFGTLWAGSTAPSWRHRGVYRALVAIRAEMARARGFALLEVEALPTSRPILERLGFRAVTDSIPFTFEVEP